MRATWTILCLSSLLGLIACGGAPVARVPAAAAAYPTHPQAERARLLLRNMDYLEKRQLVRSYITLQTLSTGQLNPTLSSPVFLEGIPRLGIPSILFLSDGQALQNRQPVVGPYLTIGSVNLIHNATKEQVYGNFEAATKVEGILSPRSGGPPQLRSRPPELSDLDLYMIRSSVEGGETRGFFCANRESFLCVESPIEDTVRRLGLRSSLVEAFQQEQLSTSQLEEIVFQMLVSMLDLEIIQ